MGKGGGATDIFKIYLKIEELILSVREQKLFVKIEGKNGWLVLEWIGYMVFWQSIEPLP